MGEGSVLFLKDNYTKLGYKNPADVAMALIYEDGPYGASVKDANFNVANKNKMKVVLTEGYDHQTKDLSSLILKLKAHKPDAVLHAGYYPDIVLFLRQARELVSDQGHHRTRGGDDNFPSLRAGWGRRLCSIFIVRATLRHRT